MKESVNDDAEIVPCDLFRLLVYPFSYVSPLRVAARSSFGEG